MFAGVWVPVPVRVALAVLLFLLPSSGVDVRVRAAQFRAAQVASARAAADRARAQAFYVPAPPVISYVRGAGPGAPSDAIGNASYDPYTHTVYSDGDPFARGHETGHALDQEVLTEGDRRYFQRLLHAPAGSWYRGTGATPEGQKSPSEWFADYYGAAATHLDPTREGVSAYAPIGPIRLKRFEAALARLGKRHGLQPYAQK